MSLFRFCSSSLFAAALIILAAPASAHPGHGYFWGTSAAELSGAHVRGALMVAAPYAGLALAFAVGLAFAARRNARRDRQQIDPTR